MMAQKSIYKPNGELALLMRERQGWTQEQLAEKAGCEVRTIRSIENSEAVSADSLERVAESLGR